MGNAGKIAQTTMASLEGGKCMWHISVLYALMTCQTKAILVSEMTYTVSSGTLNSSIPYHTKAILCRFC